MSAFQFSTALRNLQLDCLTELIGENARLEIRTGRPPPKCSAPDAGTLLASIALPRRAFARSFDGVLPKFGVWMAFASATGTAGCFRMKDASGVCVLQGTVTGEGQGGALEFDDADIEADCFVEVAEFSVIAGNP